MSIPGALTALGQSDQQIQNTLASVSAQSAANTKAIASVSSATSSSWTYISGGNQLTSSGAATAAWTTLPMAAVPSSATYVLLSGYALNNPANNTFDNKQLELRIRSPQADATTVRFSDAICAHLRSVFGTYSNGQGFGTLIVPCVNQNIQYCIYNFTDAAFTGLFFEMSINLIAYM